MKSVTETVEEQNSIEVVRDAKGSFKFTTKIYFNGVDETLVIDRMERIMGELKGRFEEAVSP